VVIPHLMEEPISMGIQKETETAALGHVTMDRFQHLLDSPVSRV
jgi:hypothetical protein